MQILSVHNKYLIRGGEDESQELERRILQENGHQVDLYEENNTRVKSLNPAQMALRTIWSTEAYQLVKQRLQNSQYNLVHIQNFFPLISPAVYYAAKEQKVPVVQSLRNYRLLCPNGLFFRDGKVCEDCLGNFIPYPGIVHACYRDNRLASASVASMLTVHRAMNTWNKMVDIYITLTEFARQKMIQGGLPAEKIVVKPNFVHPDPGIGEGSGGYALFVGRLSEEKGLDTLLAAWEKLAGKIPLKIVGDGPLLAEMIAATERIPQVECLGRRPMSEVYDLMGEATFVVFPSKWYETFGRVAVEAFAKGTPVIAANIGAIAELVDSGRTGLHFRPGDADDLTAQVEWLLANPSKLSQMRQEARTEFETKYTAEKNYNRIMEIYVQAQAVSV
ncbi:putative glycosyl transferase [Calothrix sp. NIES-2100]|uniref:glycosyltransferase family 4 protein n=1 Tax=Calothrix sp. NIES-2100 TaxID=1954172 RepID=UPI000B6010A4|nr:putative glycosyl transferase [Calothrix sp. NIES-2100]